MAVERVEDAEKQALASGEDSPDLAALESAIEAINTLQHAVVVGAPGSGKSSLARELWRRSAINSPASALLLTSSRRAASRERDLLMRLGDLTLGQTPVRTVPSLAFSILRLAAADANEPPPTLITGPDQDQILAELIAGHLADGIDQSWWPQEFSPAMVSQPVFRAQLRDLLMRAAEAGFDGAQLSDLGRECDKPAWEWAGRVLDEYIAVTVLGELTPDRGSRYDPATIVDQAIVAWESLDPTVRPSWDLVIHDDFQDATLAGARLLGTLAASGSKVVAIGNPDQTVQGFRGAQSSILRDLTLPVGAAAGSGRTALGAGVVELSGSLRHGPELGGLITSLSSHLPVIVGRVRRQLFQEDRSGLPEAVAGDSSSTGRESQGDGVGSSKAATPAVEVIVTESVSAEAAMVAHRLRRAHLQESLAWSDLAVVVRSGAQAAGVHRSLVQAGIPVRMMAKDLPLHSESAVWPLLEMISCAIDRQWPGEAQLLRWLQSVYGELDAMSLRGLSRFLRTQMELASGEGAIFAPHPIGRYAQAWWARRFQEVDQAPDVLTILNSLESVTHVALRPLKRILEMYARARETVTQDRRAVEAILWEVWEASGRATVWQQAALDHPARAEFHHGLLDAMVTLFQTAAQYVDRTGGGTIRSFLEHLTSQSFAADSLAATGSQSEVVWLHTPASAAGQEWHTVIVAGVQQDVWPDLRIRDTVFGALEFADVVLQRSTTAGADYAQARKNVADDELRSFVSAISRARSRLIVTAVANTDTEPSAFVHAIASPEGGWRVEQPPPPLDLRGLVGQLRRVCREGETAAESILEQLRDQGVSFADSRRFLHERQPSSDDPLTPPQSQVTISPSDVETIMTCPLRWLLTRHGGSRPDSASQTIGNLVHDIAADHPLGREEELHAALASRTHELGIDTATWLGRRELERARDLLSSYATYVAEHPWAVDVEVPFTITADDVELRGRVDRVEHRPGGVHIVDLKTGKQAVTAQRAQEHPQLGLYQLATDLGAFRDEEDSVERSNSGSDGASLVFLALGARVRAQAALHEQVDPQWPQRLVEECAGVLRAPRFQARIQQTCRSCPVKASCPAQSQGVSIDG